MISLKLPTSLIFSLFFSLFMGQVSYGAKDDKGGELTYYTNKGGILSPSNQFKIRVTDGPSGGSLYTAIKGISAFPFRSGSVRAIINAACTKQDIPQVSFSNY